MLTNLFSSFDPSTKSLFQMNWISMISAMMILPNKFWVSNSRTTMTSKMIKMKMNEEMSNIIKNKQIKMILMSTFTFILINNIMGLSPYTFTSTSHLPTALSLAMPLWIMLMLYGWTKSTNKMFAHLIPSGTPMLLMPFMILIETISNIMRPISLSVRLMANMIAGHLLMTLLGNLNSIKTINFILIIQMSLMTFEMAISMIQAYVFMILGTLYSSEIP
uniref:ATP synthase subunit a n=1 Tax=Iolania perkinsi TaxID=2831208 RepID=A0A8K1HZR9_9HEMI|nr:ATP synthase F0 subunit 6 [Iolania perkinsi]